MTAPTPSRRPGSRTLVMIIVMVIVLVADRVTKHLAMTHLEYGHPVNVVGDTVRWVLVFNPGAAFSFGTSMTWLFTLFQALAVIAALVVAVRIRYSPWAVGVGLVAGGAGGNLIDRLTRPPGFLHGEVIDFIAVGWWPVFNLADCGVVVGMALVAWLLVTDRDFQGRTPAQRAALEAADTTDTHPTEAR